MSSVMEWTLRVWFTRTHTQHMWTMVQLILVKVKLIIERPSKNNSNISEIIQSLIFDVLHSKPAVFGRLLAFGFLLGTTYFARLVPPHADSMYFDSRHSLLLDSLIHTPGFWLWTPPFATLTLPTGRLPAIRICYINFLNNRPLVFSIFGFIT